MKHWLPELTKPSELNAGIIRRIVGHRIAQAPGSASTITGIMRSYVRFLVSRGECEPALQHAFPPIRRYRLGTLPRYMDDATIEKIIASCQADTAVEIRDKAIILLLARLGLRAGDICQLRLTDIDWNDGYLRVSGKSRRPDRLPLPQDAGTRSSIISSGLARRSPRRCCSFGCNLLFGRSVRRLRSPASSRVYWIGRHRRRADGRPRLPAFAGHTDAARRRRP